MAIFKIQNCSRINIGVARIFAAGVHTILTLNPTHFYSSLYKNTL